MTVTTPIAELLAIARRYEVEQRFAQAAAAYQEALDNMPHPTSAAHAGDRELIEGMMRMVIWRSRESQTTTMTVMSEEAKSAIDQKGERAAAKLAAATGRPPTGTSP